MPFYFISKALLVLKIFTFLSRLFDHVGKWLDEKAKLDFKIYDNTGLFFLFKKALYRIKACGCHLSFYVLVDLDLDKE